MKKLVLLFVLLTSLTWLQAQVVYEDFESGATNGAAGALNGTFNGVVANPYPDGVNGSAFVASYTNNPDVDYNFFIDTLASAVDLTRYNMIRMKVWSPIDSTKVLFKFQGPAGAVEFIRDIRVANQWVDYSFDLGSGAAITQMNLMLVSFAPGTFGTTETFYFDEIVGVEPLLVYEEFEPQKLPWVAADGVFLGQLENPDSNSINGSDSVGGYVKSGDHAYSLLIADVGTSFDVSILNQFKIDVWAQAPTQVLLKLEGDSNSIEKTVNIGLSNEWQTYTFDFSGASDFEDLSKVILFFDPGVQTSKDTYYFDNLRAVNQGVCRGVTLDPDMIDDFECNRNATYVNGWDSLRVVTNPDPDGINNSSKVGCYTDPSGEPWATLLIDYQDSINLSTKNQLHVQIWTPRADIPILFKLEGGSSNVKEVWMNSPAGGEWVNYTIDFSSEAERNHKKLAIFFNGGQEPQASDAYYIDNIRWGIQTNFVIEDFEGGAFLPWEPLDQQTVVHGTFEVVANPDASGANQSAQVGKYTKGTSGFSTVAAVAPGVIDITSRPQYNVDVYAPTTGSVIFQLESVSEGNKEVERDIEVANEWVTLSFDFTDHQGITDWASIRMIFNPGVEEEGAMFFFDNLTQSERTIDPCEGAVEVDNIIDDFECQRNNTVLAGAELLTVVSNPDPVTANQSTYVGLYADQPNEPWAALCYDFPDGIDLSSFNQLSLQIHAEEAVPVLLKLEGGSSPQSEVWTNYTTPGEWETVSGDFSSQIGEDHRRVCIFLNGGVTTAEVDNYYIDNLQFAHAPFNSCIINFDDAAFISEEWLFFPSENTGDFELVANPDPSGINTSAFVGKAVEVAYPEAQGGAPWAGLFTNLPSYIDFGGNKTVKIKVWSPKETTVTMKIEGPQTPGAPLSTGDVTVPLTVTNEWTELTFDFNGTAITDDGRYARVTLIFDILNIPTEDVTYYFDDISLTTGECGISSIGGGPVRPEPLSIAPNPATAELRIDDLGKVTRIDVINLYGQRLSSTEAQGASSMFVQVGELHQGTYILGGYDDKGNLVAITRFVKI